MIKTVLFPGAVRWLLTITLTTLGGVAYGRTPVPIPNGSFELPKTEFVDTQVDAWQKAPKPDWYQETDEFKWDQLCGVFINPASTNSSYIDNMDGQQALYLFAVPQAGIFQDYNSLTGTNTTPTHAFAARFEVGKSYTLTMGVVGGGGGMTNGASLQLALYYRQNATNLVIIASTNIVYTPASFPTTTHLIDYQATLPAVAPGDAWAGQYVGVQILSTVDPAAAGGYWDLDNVRLEESFTIPNGSFELPKTEFVDTRVDVWQKVPKPDWYQETEEFRWDQLCGVFINPASTNSSYIDNLDGQQALYLFAVPQVGIFQDYNSLTGTNTTPAQAFAAKFEAGNSYTLTVGVVGGGGGMTNGASLQLALYYRQNGTNLVTVAATNIIYSLDSFPTTTHLIDYQVTVPAVQKGEAWDGQYVGVQILSTVAPGAAGGYWDLDNVRLTSGSSPAPSLQFTQTKSGGQLSWASTTGLDYQVEKSSDLKTWENFESALTGTSGELLKLIHLDGATNAFFRLRTFPTSAP